MAADDGKVPLSVEVCLRADTHADPAAVRAAALAYLSSLPSVRYAEGRLAAPPAGQHPLLEAAVTSMVVADLPPGRVAPNKLLLQWDVSWHVSGRRAPRGVGVGGGGGGGGLAVHGYEGGSRVRAGCRAGGCMRLRSGRAAQVCRAVPALPRPPGHCPARAPTPLPPPPPACPPTGAGVSAGPRGCSRRRRGRRGHALLPGVGAARGGVCRRLGGAGARGVGAGWLAGRPASLLRARVGGGRTFSVHCTAAFAALLQPCTLPLLPAPPRAPLPPAHSTTTPRSSSACCATPRRRCCSRSGASTRAWSLGTGWCCCTGAAAACLPAGRMLA